MEDYIQQRAYPAEDRQLSGYIMSGVDLSSDLDRVFRARDMLNSLEYEKMSISQNHQTLFQEVRDDQNLIGDSFKRVNESLEKERQLTMAEQIEKWVAEKRTPEEVTELAQTHRVKDPLRDFYQLLISAAMDRLRLRTEELEGLFSALEKPVSNPDLSDVIFDMSTSNR
jgi:hypothetical protein